MSTTGPVIWMTRPMPGAVAVAMTWVPPAFGTRLLGVRPGGDHDHLSGDVGLADLVVREGVLLDEIVRVFLCVLHRDHPRRLLRLLRFEHRLEQPARNVARHELL